MEFDAKIVWRLSRRDKKILKQLAQEEQLSLSAYLRTRIVRPYVKEQHKEAY